MIDDVKLFVLDSGESLIGKVVSETKENYCVENIVTFAPDGRGGAVTVPYLTFSKETSANFDKSKIRHVLTPNDELREYYSKQFGEIEVVSPSIVTR